MDPLGILPPQIRFNYEREQAVTDHLRAADALVVALRALDERLDLVKISPDYVGGGGVKPGYWHVKRRNDPPAPDSYMPIEHPDGTFRAPDSGVIHELQARDVWTRGQAAYPRDEERANDLKNEQLRDEFKADLKAALRTSEGGLSARKWGRG